MKMGRPRKNSVEGFALAVDQMIREYQETDKAEALTDFHLGEILGLSQSQLDLYYNGTIDEAVARTTQDEENEYNDDGRTAIKRMTDGTYKPIKSTYRAELKRLVAFRQQACVSHIAKSGGVLTGWIFLSKQARWGGFSDTQRFESDNKTNITVSIKGANGKDLLTK